MRILDCREEKHAKTPRIIYQNERGKTGSLYTLSVFFQAKRGGETVMRILGCREEKTCKIHRGLYIKMKEAKRVPSIL